MCVYDCVYNGGIHYSCMKSCPVIQHNASVVVLVSHWTKEVFDATQYSGR